jgi:hypothetical protein
VRERGDGQENFLIGTFWKDVFHGANGEDEAAVRVLDSLGNSGCTAAEEQRS